MRKRAENPFYQFVFNSTALNMFFLFLKYSTIFFLASSFCRSFLAKSSEFGLNELKQCQIAIKISIFISHLMLFVCCPKYNKQFDFFFSVRFEALLISAVCLTFQETMSVLCCKYPQLVYGWHCLVDICLIFITWFMVYLVFS